MHTLPWCKNLVTAQTCGREDFRSLEPGSSLFRWNSFNSPGSGNRGYQLLTAWTSKWKRLREEELTRPCWKVKGRNQDNNFGQRFVIIWKCFIRRNQWKSLCIHLNKLLHLMKSCLSVVQMRKPRLWEIWSLAQDHTLNKWVYSFPVLKFFYKPAFVGKSVIWLLDGPNLNYQRKISITIKMDLVSTHK